MRVFIDVHNVLYGTTVDGGPYEGNYDRGGTVFSITTGGTEKALHFFGNGTDGSAPIAPLADVKGTLYGTTESGGTYPCGHTGCGTVFSITTGGVEKYCTASATEPTALSPICWPGRRKRHALRNDPDRTGGHEVLWFLLRRLWHRL